MAGFPNLGIQAAIHIADFGHMGREGPASLPSFSAPKSIIAIFRPVLEKNAVFLEMPLFNAVEQSSYSPEDTGKTKALAINSHSFLSVVVQMNAFPVKLALQYSFFRFFSYPPTYF